MKNNVTWGIVCSLVALAACAEPKLQQVEPPAQEEAAESAALPWPDDLDVVELGNVGDLPPAERTTIIVLRANGEMTVDGARGGIEDLAQALRASGPAPAQGERRGHNVVFALDRDVRWRPVQRLMITCAIENVGQLFYAARHVASGEPGAIALFLPQDAGVRAPRPTYRPAMNVKVRTEESASDPRGLSVAIEDLMERIRADALYVNLDAAPTAPSGLVLQLCDEASSGGATSVGFVGVPLGRDEGPISDEVARLAAEPAARHVVVYDEPLPPGASDRAVPPRRHGEFAGFPASELVPQQEVEIVEPEDEGTSEPR